MCVPAYGFSGMLRVTLHSYTWVQVKPIPAVPAVFLIFESNLVLVEQPLSERYESGAELLVPMHDAARAMLTSLGIPQMWMLFESVRVRVMTVTVENVPAGVCGVRKLSITDKIAKVAGTNVTVLKVKLNTRL